MGQTAAQTVKEIEQTRERLGDELRLLEERMPSPARIGRQAVRIVAGGGTGAAIAWMLVRKARKRSRAKAADTNVPLHAVISLLPAGIGTKLEDAIEEADMRSLVTGIGVTMVLLRMLELRRLRALNRALLSVR